MAIKQAISPVLQELPDAASSGAAISTERYAAAVAGLDLAQQRAALSAKELRKTQQESVIAMVNAASAAESLSLKEAAAAVGITEEKLAIALNIQATDKLTASKLLAAVAEERLTRKQYDDIIAKAQSIAANKALGASYDELTLKQKLAVGAAAMTPMGWVSLAVSFLPLVVTGASKLYDLFTKAAERAREAADELHSAFEETKSELEGVNSELKTANDRIAELQKLSEAGTISIVEQEELENLREEVGLLEQRERFLKAQKEREAKESNDALEDAFTKKTFTSDLYTYAIDGLRKERDELDKVRKSWTDADEARYNEIVASISRLGEMSSSGGIDTISGMRRSQSMGYAEYIQLLIDRYNELNKTAEKSASDFYEMDALEGRLADIGVNLTGFIEQFEGESDVKTFWQKLSEDIDRTINKAEYFTEALENLPSSAKGKLEAIGKSGKLTAESVDELAREFPELKAWMEESGYTAKDVASNFNALSTTCDNTSAAVQETKKSFAETLDSLSASSKNIEGISKALGEFSENGKVSVDTLSGMSDEVKNLSSFDNFANVLNDSASTMEEVKDACNQLAKEYIDTTGILDDVNEANARLIETQLEEMGVVNAHEIIQARLNATRLNGILAANGLTDATWAETEAFLKESGAAASAIASLKQLRQEEYNAALASQDLVSASTNSIAALISQAKAAGIAAESVAGLGKALKLKEDYAKGKLSGMTLSEYHELMDSYSRQAKADISGISVTVPTIKVDLPRSNESSSSSKSNSSSKELEEYIADIDKYREATERLRKAQEDEENIDRRVNDSEDMRQRILLEHQLIGAYQNESDAVRTLNKLRSDTITDNAESLRELGFEVRYNADSNELWISNLEHLNELTAASKGKYDSLQEATNALRKETEELIDATASLNEENRDGADSIYKLGTSIHASKVQIIDDLKEIVSKASDSVDEIQNVYDTLKAAADEYAEDGFISVDAYQSIIDLGPQYMQYLRDENGLLIINEENINKVIAAKTRQLAAEQALTYVERLRLALEEGSIENLNTMLYATTEATDATFGLAYAQLAMMHSMGDLDDRQYAAALHNIQSIESLANTAIASVGKVAGESSEKTREELEDMKSGVDDILKYVMDMLKHRIQQQVDALEDLKDAYGDIIDLRKEALDAAKQEADYEDKVAEKVNQIAKLQERINALSLDDSRDAQAQKIKLEEEMAELQKELANDQSDYAVDAQKDALDDMKEAYEDEKDAEIKALEETISSYQKLYDMAIDYIESHWNTLYDELIQWNTTVGNSLNSEITEAWNNCLAAAQRYGNYVSALNNIGADIEAAGNTGGSSVNSSGNNTIVGNSSHSSASKEDNIHAIIKEMYSNMNEHGGSGSSTSSSRKAWLSNRNLQLGAQLSQYGVPAYRSTDREDFGTWYTDRSKSQLLFEKYKKYIYHRGGIAGDNPTLKQNEIMAVLEKGEAVLDEQKERGLYRLVEFATVLSDKFGELIRSSGLSSVLTGSGGLADVKPDAPSNVTNSEKVSIEFGDTIIYGANEDTVERHRAITRQQANELFDKLNIKR